MATFTNTWNAANEASPADTDSASAGASKIRDFKLDYRERMEIDHSMAGDVSDGEHKQVTLIEQASDPANVADRGFVYTKDVSGTTELFYEDESGNVTQLTNVGTVNSPVGNGYAAVINNLSLDTSVAANALTINVNTRTGTTPTSTNKVTVGFRQATLTDGTYVLRELTAALSLVVPQGATLGFAADEDGYIHLYLVDNAGTMVLAVSKNPIFDDAELYSTTLIDSTSDDADTLYSAAAQTTKAIRYIGRLRITTGATAGDWDTAPVEETPLPTFKKHGMEAFTSNGTFTVPKGVYQIRVEGFGASGGGGGEDGSNSGGNGGSGGYAESILDVSPGESISVTIGAAGACSNIVDGSAGGATSIDAISITGGGGGQRASLGGADGADGVGTGTITETINAGKKGVNPGGQGEVGGSPNTCVAGKSAVIIVRW